MAFRGGRRVWSRRALTIAAFLLIGGPAVPARADSDDAPASTQKPQTRSAPANAARAIGADEIDGPTIFEGIPSLAPIDDLRDRLRDTYGLYLHGNYIGDPYGDIGGGVRRGAAYAGRLDLQLDVDADKVAHLTGTTLHANAYQIHGRDLTNDIGNLLSSNDIAALPTTRLYELWIEQKFGESLSVRAGQIGIDVEFLTSDYGANFIDATFGWPGLPALDLPEGGPAYPLATPAVRVRFNPVRSLTILAAVFDGEPAGPGPGNPQARDPSGLNFRLSDPPLVFTEAQYRYNQVAQGGEGLPGTLKVGGFAHFDHFPDQRFGPLVQHTPDYGVYGVVDQQVYRVSGDEPDKGVGLFARIIAAPADRNLVDFYADAGFAALGLVPGREEDLFGLAAAFAHISPEAAAADRATSAATEIAAPVRDFEAVIEATYQIRVIPGFTLQPTFQYVMHPGGNIADPLRTGLAPIRNAEVLGVTTIVRF